MEWKGEFRWSDDASQHIRIYIFYASALHLITIYMDTLSSPSPVLCHHQRGIRIPTVRGATTGHAAY